MRLHIGLVHYPVYNKNEQRIASAVTPVDLHDLARIGRTYGVTTFTVVTPLKDQQGLVERIRHHWTAGFGASYNPHRKKALELVTLTDSLEDGIEKIHSMEKEEPFVLATDASRQKENMLSFPDARDMIRQDRVVFLLFGTAWGLDQEVLRQSDAVLEPVMGVTAYNHLPVRAAAAIILDRLVGAHP
ncbi:MAG: RNA methyltransferase [Deltaproteobacteria bacterium]|nr:MAG: hypothetical protein B1H13_11410 [Desulfobacteraceae bacterium 4484_190.3]RLB19334.1 MAG: RNA methyltransferase [Deltaproteobacteria bacterium]